MATSYFDRIPAKQAKRGMRWLDVTNSCSLIQRIVSSQVPNHLDIYCEGTKAGIGQGVREPAIDIHNVHEDQVLRVQIYRAS